MIDEKIDHHFNELSPVDFNIFQGSSLYDKLRKENLDNEKAKALRDHIIAIKDQIESLLNGEDEQLNVVYGFLNETEQGLYLSFLTLLEQDINKYISKDLRGG